MPCNETAQHAEPLPPSIDREAAKEKVADEVEQRWNTRRSLVLRPSSETFDPAKHGVEVVDRPTAKQFVETHHYSGSFSTCRLPVGLFRKGRGLVGVCVFGNPTSARAAACYFKNKYSDEVLEHNDCVGLNRFVLLDDVEWLGETWFLARARRLLRKRKPGVRAIVSYADPVPRVTEEGSTVMPGHVGTIYQAWNGVYVGRSGKETKHLTPSGIVVDRRMTGKIRNEQRGAAKAYEDFRRLGAPKRRLQESGKAYVERALREGPFSRVRHPGNHVYCWALDRKTSVKKAALPFPKQIEQLQPC